MLLRAPIADASDGLQSILPASGRGGADPYDDSPETGRLMIEGYNMNRDCRAHVGQPAVMKSMHSLLRGSAIEGMVSTNTIISVTHRSTQTRRSAPADAGASDVEANARGLVYSIVIDLERGKEGVAAGACDSSWHGRDGRIRTRRRRVVIEYLLWPLRRPINEAGHEH